jgi:hypothetical protein
MRFSVNRLSSFRPGNGAILARLAEAIRELKGNSIDDSSPAAR